MIFDIHRTVLWLSEIYRTHTSVNSHSKPSGHQIKNEKLFFSGNRLHRKIKKPHFRTGLAFYRLDRCRLCLRGTGRMGWKRKPPVGRWTETCRRGSAWGDFPLLSVHSPAGGGTGFSLVEPRAWSGGHRVLTVALEVNHTAGHWQRWMFDEDADSGGKIASDGWRTTSDCTLRLVLENTSTISQLN